MKKLLLLAIFITGPVLAQVSYISGGEAKILYSCDVLESIPREKEEREMISFFEKGLKGLNDLGLILRFIRSQKGDELTLKFRTQRSLPIDETIYRKLSASTNGEFKCEEDVNYGLSYSNSCSFKAPGDDFRPEHADLARMVGVDLPDLSNLRRVDVSSISWKLKLTPAQAQKSPLIKKPSVEVWTFRDVCILEVSGKYQAPVDARAALTFLEGLVNARPAQIQGNKTGLALGI
ncbi:hypothetical protein [Peredibacter starrii]|uniref:Uncharacterized protein n=1 Tax=Peredibacter starrii TaxID=28202 RepID=A0AAX4HLA3_9BACT|nr:hypothetical protein [Peredibacter starrii]WPU63903.1 hypothetical protein SOO65_14505 [Peredibacter starrii]